MPDLLVLIDRFAQRLVHPVGRLRRSALVVNKFLLR